MSFFTMKEIEMHRESSRKIPGFSVKTLDCGRKLKVESDVVEI